MNAVDAMGLDPTVDDVLAVMRREGTEPTRDGAMILLDRFVAPQAGRIRDAAGRSRPEEPSFSSEIAAKDGARRAAVADILREVGLIGGRDPEGDLPASPGGP
jgi:hypothetical protein